MRNLLGIKLNIPKRSFFDLKNIFLETDVFNKLLLEQNDAASFHINKTAQLFNSLKKYTN